MEREEEKGDRGREWKKGRLGRGMKKMSAED